MRRFLRYSIIVLAALTVVALLLVWIGRDWPRRFVERSLAAKLEADVRLGGLEILGSTEFVLHDLIVERMPSQPQLARFGVERLEVLGELGAIRAGRLDTLRLTGVEVRLEPSVAVVDETTSEVTVRRLVVSDGRVIVAAGGEETHLTLSAKLESIGGDARGEVILEGQRVLLSPLLRLLREPDEGGSPLPVDGVLAGVRVAVRLGDPLELRLGADRAELAMSGNEMGLRLERPVLELSARGDFMRPKRVDGHLQAEAGELSRVQGQPAALGSPRIEVKAGSVESSGAWQVELVPSVEHVGSGRVALELGPDLDTLRSFEGELKEIELDHWLPTLIGHLDGWSVRGLANARASGSSTAIEWSADARLSEVKGTTGELDLAAGGARLDVRGETNFADGRVTGPVEVRLELPRLDGTLGGRRVPPSLLPLVATLEGRVDWVDALRFDGVAVVRSEAAGRLRAEGAATAIASRPSAELSWEWREARLDSLQRLAVEAGIDLPDALEPSGTVAASGTMRGPLAAPALRGSIELAELGLSERDDAGGSAWSASEGEARLDVRFHGDGRPAEISLERFTASLTVPPLDPLPLEATGEAEGGLDSGIEIERLELHSKGLFRTTVQGQWSRGGDGKATAELTGEPLPRWQAVLAPLLGDTLEGYTVHGAPSARLEARLDPTGRWSVTGDVILADGGFVSDDGARVAQGLSARCALEVEGGGELDEVRGRAHTRLGNLMLLWGGFFADLSEAVADLSTSATFRVGEEGWSRRGRLGLEMPAGPRIDLSFDDSAGEGLSYDGRVHVADLDEAFERYVRGPLDGSVESIDRLRAKGSFEAEIAGRIDPARRTARGRVRLDDLLLGGAEGGFAVEGLDLDLPFEMVWDDDLAAPRGEARHGSVGFRRLSLGTIALPQTGMDLVAQGDSIRVAGRLTVPLLGGELTLDEPTFDELLKPSRHLQTGIVLEGVSLRQVSEAAGLFPLEGTVRGSFPRVRLTRELLETEGDARFELFGGDLVVSGVRGRDLLSRFPRLILSAEFEGIDLGQFTRAIDFGEMTGVLRGRVVDFESFRGVPVRFRGELETVKRRGTRQTINVKAIDNLSILGTGGKIGVLDRGLHRFLDQYTYRKLGIDLRLENDRLEFRGTIRDDGKEYFVRGRRPFPINVINARPGQAVSLQTMMKRLQSLEIELGPPPARPQAGSSEEESE